ncbi:MAG: hypothetical protein H0W11_07320, partial [Gemmatimonadetes bacterium]|nr:hypothetical protein [Gemmatimonadota bacterium]
LVREISGAAAEFTDTGEGSRALGKAFANRNALLVVDDVWDAGHARAFDVAGEGARLLLTTRDSAVLTAVGATDEPIERLSEEAALALLAEWSGTRAERLPEAASDVARECGYLPLALSVAGARVRDGASWEDVLEALEQGRLEFLDHPYASVFGSLRLSVDALPDDERARYLELAVFPEDVQVPESVVLRLWRQTGGMDAVAARDLLARLKSKALLERGSDGERRFVTLHDLQHDFVRLLVNDLPAVHANLLDALAAELPVTDEAGSAWHLLPPDEPYPWLHLGDHLVSAGRREEFRELLLDPRWLEAKLRAVGMSALLSDFTAFPHDPDLAEVVATLRLCSHVVSKHPEQLSSQLLARLLDTDRETVRGTLSRVAPEGVWLRPLTASLPRERGLIRTLSGHSGSVSAVAITPDGRQALSASWDQTLKLWDLESGAELRTLSGHSGWVWAVAISPDGRQALSASNDQTLKLWDLESGAELRILSGHSGWVNAVAITPDGRQALSASDNLTLKLWELESGAELRTLRGNSGLVSAVAITPDGRQALSASDDRTLKLWDLESGAELRTVSGHSGPVNAVAISPDGRQALSASGDRTLKLWDLESGREIAIFSADALVLCCAVTPDGKTIVAGDALGRLHFLRIEGLPPSNRPGSDSP